MNRYLKISLIIILAAVANLAAFGIDHASESLIIAISSPIILVLAITVGVTLCLSMLLVGQGRNKYEDREA